VFPQYRYLAATLAARRSADRSTLDLLLATVDLTTGWHKTGEGRYRMGFVFSEDRDKRARRAELIGATRSFADAESGSRIHAWAYPHTNQEDARSAVASAFERRIHALGSYDLNAQTRHEAAVTPPPEAGEHARARLVSTTGSKGSWRTLTVAWADSGPLFLGIIYRAPAEVDVWDLMSALVRRQRERLGYRPSNSAD
jgi:hypothetical protein